MRIYRWHNLLAPLGIIKTSDKPVPKSADDQVEYVKRVHNNCIALIGIIGQSGTLVRHWSWFESAILQSR